MIPQVSDSELELMKIVWAGGGTARYAQIMEALARADKERADLLDALGELAYKKSTLANQFYKLQCMPEQGWAEKRAKKERERLQRVIDLLKAERWDA